MTESRPVRVAAGESAEVSCTVNGTPVTLRVPARLTLADALRDRLHLTGTHLGCEHGVCGMCTVLVDGAAARSCLMFACQADGAAIVTAEGLGTQQDQHPLQEAFGRHHAVQCGFCTPGFLLSSYDLLAHRPGVAEADLPAELSGVLCRCTGYRNIVAAVAEVAAAYPDGLPGPRNLAPPPDIPESSDVDESAEIVLPQGEPTVRVEVTSVVAAPVAAVWRVLADVRSVAGCLPGAELTEELGGDRYRGRAAVSVGPIRLSFRGVARVVERDADARVLRVLAGGADESAGQTQADIRLSATPEAAGTRLRATAEVYLTGRIAQFGRALAGDVSRRMFERFADAVARTATSGIAPELSGRPTVGGVGVVLGVLRDRLRALFRWRHARRGSRPR